MRILITSTGSWGTGSFVAVNALTQKFQNMGHKVKVFFPDLGLPAKDKDYYYQNPELYIIWEFPIEKNQIKLPTFPLMIPDPHPRTPVILTFKELSDEQLKLYFAAFKENIKKVIDKFQPDIIECQHIWAMAHIIHELGLPYFITAHHSDQMGFNFDPRMRPIAKHSASSAQYIFTISNFVKNEVLKLYNVPSEKIIVLPNGYDKLIFKRKKINRKKFLANLGINIPPQADIVNFTGKISYTKGIDIILQANRILNNPNIHFLMFGAGDIKDITQNKYLPDNLHFLGHQTQEVIAQAHNIAKLGILPSRAEGFGIAGLEAMGCGLPIVVTKNTEPENFAVGEIIEQENPQQLAKAILKIVNLSKQQYNNLSSKAVQATHRFSWESVAKMRLHYYQEANRHPLVDRYGNE